MDIITNYKCPKCGYEVSENAGLDITIPPYSGKYCLKCWAAEISKVVPKMDKIDIRLS